MKVHLLAIAGGSGSGKTWLAERLVEECGPDAGRLSLDDFYQDLSQRTPAERSEANFDHPQAIDWPLFRRTLTCIQRGETTDVPVYDFDTHTRRAETKRWRPCRLVVLDGLWLMRRAELRRLYSLSVFVDCPEKLRFERRLARDRRERGRSVASIRTQFESHVAPMHDRYVTGQIRHADLVVGSPSPAADVAELRQRCQKLLLQK